MSTTALWGIGKLGGGPLSLSQRDFDDDVVFGEEILQTMNIGAGDLVVFTLAGSEIAHVAPLEEAVSRRGGYFCSAEAMGPDAPRTAFLIRELPVKAVVGLGEETVEELAAKGEDLQTLFGTPPVVWARPGAYERLTDLGTDPYRCFMLGPTLGLECPERSGVHVNGAAWLVEANTDGELIVSSHGHRAAQVSRFPTGIKGSVLTDPCACGNANPRVELEPAS